MEYSLDKEYVFYDQQTGGYSAHTTIDGLAEMLIDDHLQVIGSDENYKGEYEHEKEQWAKADIEDLVGIIFENQYEILEASDENKEERDRYVYPDVD